MKMTTLKSVAIAVGLASSAFGQATSPVVGYYTETLNQGFNALGVNLHGKPVASGEFESELVDSEGAFTTALGDASKTYLLEITSGPQNGAVAEVTATDDTTLSVGSVLGAGAASYVVREAQTLDDVFSSLAGGTFLAGNEDIVWVPNGSGGYDTYALNTGASQFRLTSAFFTPLAKSVPVFYPDGVFVEKKSAGSQDLVISGDLKATPTVLAANTGFNLVASPGPVGVTLGNSGLQATLTGGTFLDGSQDLIWLPGTGGFTTYAYNTGSSEWRTTASFFFGSQNDTALTSAFFIERKGASTAVSATLPSIYDGL